MAFLGVKEGKFQIPQLVLHWGLSHHQPKGLEWKTNCGVILRGHRDHGLPFLRARVILIYLATKLLVEGDSFSGSLREINEWFDIDWPLKNLEKHFLRVVHAESGCGERCPCDYGQCQGPRNPIAYWIDYDKKTHTFDITMSSYFRYSVERGVWAPCAPIRRLAQTDQMAALDLFVFYQWRWQRMKCMLMDTLGANGPFVFLKSAKVDYRKLQELFRLHQRVVEVWPDCPFHLSIDGRRISCNPDRRPRVRRVCKQPPRGRGRKPLPPSKRARRPVRRTLQKRPPPFVCQPLKMDSYRPDRRKVQIIRGDEAIMAWVARNEQREREGHHF